MMKKERVLQIQALRALACFSVLVDHTKVPSTVGIGQFGVFIFFMISGYVMMLSTERTDNSGMLVKRFLRIAPPYYVMTAAIIAINLVNQYVYTFKEYTDISPYKIFTSVFFLAFLPNGLSTIVSVGWTVSIEMFFYLLFYVASRISFRFRGLLTIGGILFIQMVSSPLIALGMDIPYARYHMIFFAIGIAVWYLKQFLIDKIDAKWQSKSVQYAIIFSSIVAFVVICVFYHDNTQTMCVLSTVTLIFSLWILFLDQFKFHRAIIWMGDRSFAIYLTHALTLQFCIQLVHPLNEWDFTSIAYFVAYFAFMMLVAEVFYQVIEKRVTGWIVKKYRSRMVEKR